MIIYSPVMIFGELDRNYENLLEWYILDDFRITYLCY
jgi:hypothetical protein